MYLEALSAIETQTKGDITHMIMGLRNFLTGHLSTSEHYGA